MKKIGPRKPRVQNLTMSIHHSEFTNQNKVLFFIYFISLYILYHQYMTNTIEFFIESFFSAKFWQILSEIVRFADFI